MTGEHPKVNLSPSTALNLFNCRQLPLRFDSSHSLPSFSPTAVHQSSLDNASIAREVRALPTVTLDASLLRSACGDEDAFWRQLVATHI
jgi:hypothetical protein